MKRFLFLLALAVSAFAQTASTTDISVAVGTNQACKLVASAQGSAPLAYQWRKDGVAIAGATANTLDLGTYATTKAGVYDVVVSNEFGSATSKKVTLSTGLPPTIGGVTVTKIAATAQ